MALDEQQLLDLKDKIEAAKTNVSSLNGQKQAMMKQLKDDWGCDTIEQAEEKLKQMDKNIGLLDKKIDSATKELEKTIEVEGEE
jgi:predicted  nucleic acid-binding Zn-ribbon protein